MKKKQELVNFKKKIHGITLIALVVTIIVLLILSAVAINLTIGSNGIFKRAKDSVDEYEKAASEEDISLKTIEKIMDYYAGDLDYVEDIFDFKGMYEIISKDGLTIIDGVREENGTLYREEIEIYSEDNFNVNKKEKIAQLEEKAVIFKDFLFENYENIEVLQYTQEEVILKYKI